MAVPDRARHHQTQKSSCCIPHQHCGRRDETVKTRHDRGRRTSVHLQTLVQCADQEARLATAVQIREPHAPAAQYDVNALVTTSTLAWAVAEAPPLLHAARDNNFTG